MPRVVTLHYIFHCDDGPILTELDPAGFAGQEGGRSAVACDPKRPALDVDFRATPEPWLVTCRACRASEAFKAADRPHPRDAARAAAQGGDGRGCCP